MKFGVFNNFWDGHPNHLPFLNLRESEDDPKEWNLQTSLSKLYSILTSNPDEDVNEGIRQLITSGDWRPHLVAAISILSFESNRRIEFIELLWDRLSLIDKDFTPKASKILDAGFPVSYTSLSAIEHHASRGGTNAAMASAKVIAVINFILHKTVRDSPGSDQGASIAKDWEERLNKLIHRGKISIG